MKKGLLYFNQVAGAIDIDGKNLSLPSLQRGGKDCM